MSKSFDALKDEEPHDDGIHRTGDYPMTNFRGHLTVKSGAYRYLKEHVDPGANLLVFLWGTFGPETKPHWLVSVSSRSSLPPNAEEKGVFGELINDIPFLVVQPEHLPKLDGCTLFYEAGALAVRRSDQDQRDWTDQQFPTGEQCILAH